jgi:membrane-associated phospholipid phosphatase
VPVTEILRQPAARGTQTEIGRRTTFLTVAYLGITAILILVRGRALPASSWIVAAHVAVCVLLAASLQRRALPRALVVLLDWHPLVLFPLLYKEVELLAAVFGNWKLTATISAIESVLFLGQPSLYLSERVPVVALSEVLHFCYLSYIVVIPAVATYWYLSGRRAAFHEFVLLLAAVMFGSYLLFILFPVDSPYYRFDPLGPPLAGHFFFNLVHAVSSLGGARGGAFPSTHVSGAMVLWLVAWRRQPRLAAVLTPLILGMIAATVYGRFHYALDIVAGVGLALVAMVWYLRQSNPPSTV